MSERKIFACGLSSPVWEHLGFFMKTESGIEVLDKSKHEKCYRYTEQKDAVEATLKSKDLKFKDVESIPTTEKGKLIDELVHLLGPFKTATEELITSTHPTISLVYNVKKLLVHQLHPTAQDSHVIAEMKNAMRADLEPRYADSEPFLIECTMLDPRLKTTTFPSEIEKEEALKVIKEQMTSIINDDARVPDILVEREDENNNSSMACNATDTMDTC
ncbi:E3 SUMO-protein ligase ZBED1-like [Dreissena polymorpha]|uniref:E3 SUMO-protein ligase ZBED1-like n=1 Tax=Dreissena polymorpha TaxID=45954 RepID=UPI0022647535|nr:E3 SUMO-protein ligase ZBED1-like [Dreissena polymorpha]